MNLIIEVTTTCGCQESARKLVDLLVEARLAACVQISGPIESVYRWQGKINREAEWQCRIKSSVRVKKQLLEFIATHHDYDVPQVVVAMVEASERYAQWVEAEVVVSS